MLFIIVILVNLSNGIVSGFLCLDEFVCDFDIRVSFSLEIGLGVNVSFNFIFPSAVISFFGEENFVGRGLSYLLIFS
jgi:hypothetical protein